MTDEGTASARDATARLFFAYTAALLPIYSFVAPKEKKPLRIPHAYSLLAAMNDLLIGPDVLIKNGKIQRRSWPSRPVFEAKMINDEVWVRKDIPAKTIRQFGELHFVTLTGDFRVTHSGAALLIRHAKVAYEFFVPGPLPIKTEADWISLNKQIFSIFFLGEFGKAWSKLRARLNNAIINYRGGKSAVDPFSRNRYYWVVFNLVAWFSEVKSLKLGDLVDALELNHLASLSAGIVRAEEELVRVGILKRKVQGQSNLLVIGDDFREEVDDVFAKMELGLSSLKEACEQFGRQQ